MFVTSLGVVRACVSPGATMLVVIGGWSIWRSAKQVCPHTGCNGGRRFSHHIDLDGEGSATQVFWMFTRLTLWCAWGRSRAWRLWTPSTLRCVPSSMLCGFKGPAVDIAAPPEIPRSLRLFSKGPLDMTPFGHVRCRPGVMTSRASVMTAIPNDFIIIIITKCALPVLKAMKYQSCDNSRAILLSHSSLGWLYVFISFPPPPRPPPQQLLPLTSKPFELNFRYLAQRTYESMKMYWVAFRWP